jgi:hypothetical protein
MGTGSQRTAQACDKRRLKEVAFGPLPRLVSDCCGIPWQARVPLLVFVPLLNSSLGSSCICGSLLSPFGAFALQEGLRFSGESGVLRVALFLGPLRDPVGRSVRRAKESICDIRI